MKTLYSSLLFIFLGFFSYSQELDSLKVIEIPESYANRQGQPFMVKKDSLYRFLTSDIYLVNKKSFLALESFYKNVSNRNDMTNALLENYTKTLRRNIALESKLKINFDENDALDKAIYQRTQATLINTQKALDYTIHSLDKATNSLEIVDKTVKKQRMKGVFEKVLIAIGGIGIGVLVGVSL
ncbi:hypothetical protein [Aquimarina longa]|uniref:hypothetical protein n=1 Tax=Aquimarina longa TaxID=1080221 RepID=UPI0007841558|nr:hypothetical protein [Aquimarina longa]